MFENKTEKRLSFGPLTLRYVFFAFVALIIGVAAAEFFITEKEWITYTAFGILSAFAVLAFILGGLKARSVALVCLIACVTGFCAFFIQKNGKRRIENCHSIRIAREKKWRMME